MFTAAAIAPVSVSTALRGFESWAASRVLAPAEFIPDRDKSPQVDGHPDRYVPDVEAEWNHVGYQLGSDGVLADVEAVFSSAPSRDYLQGGFAFVEGQHAGYSRYARNLGFEAGLEGETDTPPPSIPGRFAAAYQLGHSEGIEERRDRGESMAEYFRLLADEHEEFAYQRELEHLAREAGGWDRLVGREME